jgi:hypothetical protein
MLANAPRWASFTLAALATSLLSTAALADDSKARPPADSSWTQSDLPELPAGQTPQNVQVQPDGSVVVTRTPDSGVEVHARTPTGTVHAYGCDRVVFDPNDKSAPAGAPPCAAPPPPPPAPPPPSPYAYSPHYYPAYPPARVYRMKPDYAPDPGRKAALIASSLIFSLGTVAAGSSYLISIADRGIDNDRCSLLESCGNKQAAASLYAMGGIMTFTPSIPRFVVGDWGMGLLWTGLRAGSFALGTAVNWGSDGAFMPITFAFIAPLTLGIIDLATTPHRENLHPRKVQLEAAGFQLEGVGPTAMFDRAGNAVPALGAMGRF